MRHRVTREGDLYTMDKNLSKLQIGLFVCHCAIEGEFVRMFNHGYLTLL